MSKMPCIRALTSTLMLTLILMLSLILLISRHPRSAVQKKGGPNAEDDQHAVLFVCFFQANTEGQPIICGHPRPGVYE